MLRQTVIKNNKIYCKQQKQINVLIDYITFFLSGSYKFFPSLKDCLLLITKSIFKCIYGITK